MPSRYNDLTIILPTLNEEKNIPPLLDFLIENYPGICITIVDDSSTDSTVPLASSKGYGRLSIIERKGKRRGLTASILEGIGSVRTEFFIVMDSDFQHPPEKIAELYGLLKEGADLAIMCRSRVEGWPVHRKALSLGASFLGTLRLKSGGCPTCPDILSGYFGARTQWALRNISSCPERFEPSGYKFLFDFLKGLKSGEARIAEAPYTFSNRLHGRSKIGLPHILAYARSLFR